MSGADGNLEGILKIILIILGKISGLLYLNDSLENANYSDKMKSSTNFEF